MAKNYFLESFLTGLSVGVELKKLMMDIEEKEALEEAGDTLADAEGEDWTKGQGPGASATTEAINTMAEASAMGADGSVDPANIPSAAAELMDSAAKAGADIKMPEPKEGSGDVRLPQGVSGEDLDFGSVTSSNDPRELDMGTGSMTQEAKLGMIGGVKPDGGVYQSLEGQGDAHSEEPGYKDYSQLFREYRFDRPNENWIQVGERGGKPVYAAPDYARDEDGNYINVSASEAQALARERGSLVPTRDEYKTLFEKANPIAMATSREFGKNPADVTSQEYTAAMQARLQEAGIDPGRQPVVHGKEFFRDSMPAQPAQQNLAAASGDISLTGDTNQDAAQVRAGLIKRGLPEHIATGITMNFISESGLNPSIRGDGGKSVGFGQWYNDRAQDMIQRANAQGRDWRDPDYQLDYTIYDLKNNYPGVLDGMLKTNDPRKAADLFLREYEIPAAKYREQRSNKYLGADVNSLPWTQQRVRKQVEKGINLDPGTQGIRPAIPEPEKEEKETPRPLFEQTGRGVPPIPMDDGGSV